jgi:hypothetical protein
VISVGGNYPVAVDVYDDTGALTNAATVVLTVYLPDGTTVTPTVPNPPDVVGQYRYPYLTVMAGRHALHVATTSPVTTFDDEFDVAPVPSGAIVSLSAAKRRLNIDPADTSFDDELTGWIAGLTATVEQLKHEVIARREISEETDGKGCTFRLWNPPILSLASVESLDGMVTWDPADMRVSARSGLVRVLSGNLVHGRLAVTYTAGYQVIPPNYTEAALVILANLWDSEERGAMGVRLGGDDEQVPRQWQGGYWGLIPRRAQELLGMPGPLVA